MEDHFDIVIGEDSLADVVTVSDLAELVYHLLGERVMIYFQTLSWQKDEKNN